MNSPIEDQVDDFLADSVVASRVVVSSIFFASDELLRMEQLPVSSCSDLVDDCGFQIDEDCPRNVFPCSRLGEERVEGVVT